MDDIDKPFTVNVHYYKSPTRHSTAYELGPEDAPNAVIGIGGLSDGPHTMPAMRTLPPLLDGSNGGPVYSLFEIRMRSSYIGFGTSSLAEDVVHISCLVQYLRSLGKKKIVLMGHSTGCQDIMEYVDEKHNAEPVDGFILQGPVSDRESIVMLNKHFPDDDFDAFIEAARKLKAEGREQDCIPTQFVPKVFQGTPMSAYRVLSLAEKGGDDDYFSSDRDDEFVAKVWGRFKKPVMVLHSGEDEYVREDLDKEGIIKKWADAGKNVSPLSGVIPGAGHDIQEKGGREWFAKRVAEFLATLE